VSVLSQERFPARRFFIASLLLLATAHCSTHVSGTKDEDRSADLVDDNSGSGGETAQDGLGGGAPNDGAGAATQINVFECEPGTKRTVECGFCGGLSESCAAEGRWLATEACFTEGSCEAGTQEDGSACGDSCGVQRRTCLANCEWGEWFCVDQGECSASSSEDEDEGCESCGLERSRSRTCEEDCSWSAWTGWSACEAAPCSAGQVETESEDCGACGTRSRSRTCDGCGFPSWGEFGSCEGEGPCTPGAVGRKLLSCGWCGSQERTRTCQNDCQWGEWGQPGACQDQGDCDPNSGPQEIGRDCGNCGSGTQTAVTSCSASCELQVGEWGSCTGSTGCSPGDVKAHSVDQCGNGAAVWVESTCSSSCAWVEGDFCCSSQSNCDASGCH